MDEEPSKPTENQQPENDQASQSEEDLSGRVLTSSTCHNLTCYSEPDDSKAEAEDDKENSRLFKNKSESDLVVNKNRLSKIYLPAEDTMDLEQSFKEQTAKKYSSSWFYGDASKKVYPTIEEQVKLCRKIASQLVDDDNRKSKGASMFFKRVKRAAKWVHPPPDTATPAAQCNGSSSSSSLAGDEEMEKLKRNLKLDVKLPNLKLILDPRELLSLEKLKKTGDIVEHNVVSPDVCHNLIKELEESPNSPEINKGAAIFLKRKEKSRDWVVDENSAVVQAREQKREQELRKQAEENVQKEWLLKRQKEAEEQSLIADFDLSGQQKVAATLYIQAKQPLKLATKKTDNCSNVSQASQPAQRHHIQSNQFLKLNFKNFNRDARGWGVAANEYEKQFEKLQELPEYRPNIAPPSTVAQPNQPKFSSSFSSSANSFSGPFSSPFDGPSNSPFTNNQQASRQPVHSSPSPHYHAASNYSPHQALPASKAPVDERNRQPHIVARPKHPNIQATISPVHRPAAGQRSKVSPQQIAYSNSIALLNAAQHQANLANFSNYLFDKDQPNKRFAVRNYQQPIYGGSPCLNGGHLFDDLQNSAAAVYDLPAGNSSRPSYELTKIEIPKYRLPKFKDFNSKPKLFIRGYS